MTVSEELAILTAITESVREVVLELGMDAVFALSMFPSAERLGDELAKAA